MPIQKLRPSFTFTEDRLKQLEQLVPEAFADGKVDWQSLQEALGEELEDPREEHFGLTWPGKREARKLASIPSRGTLVPCPGEGINEDTTESIFIEGENLEVLKILQKSYAGKIKMIYIDPPYNTGNDFIYNDNFTDPLKAYLDYSGSTGEAGELLTSNTRADGRFHSRWMNMIYPRLLIARQLLREDGLIFISIDDNEVHNLKQIMIEIFGEENFISEFVWEKMYTTKNDAYFASVSHEYVLSFSKNFTFAQLFLLPRTETMNNRYKNIDNDPRGPWKPIPLYAAGESKNGRYEIKSPSGKIYEPPPNSHWRYNQEYMENLILENRIYFGRNLDALPNKKTFLSEVQQGAKVKSLWSYSEVGSNDSAKKELRLIFTESSEPPFSFPKPSTLIQHMLKLSTKALDEDIVLDFFSGSGTTAHAVLQQNIEDLGNRKFILVQFPEFTPINSQADSSGFNKISDICKERIRRVITRLKESNPLYTQDLGFKVFSYQQSSFKSWVSDEVTDPTQAQRLFENNSSPLMQDFSPSNLLTELLLLEGYPLTTKFSLLDSITANTVYEAAAPGFCDHKLFICLDDKINPLSADQLVIDKHDIFICLDTALTDQLKVRLADQFNVHII